MRGIFFTLLNVALLLLPSFFTSCFGQKYYSDGYIITLQSDTIYGKIKDRSSGHTIKFIDENGQKKRYSAREINGYSKAGLVRFMAIEYNIKREFAKILVDGEVKLLTIRKSSSQSPNNGFSSRDIYYFYNSKTLFLTKVLAFDFKHQASVYFNDYEQLREMILNKELRYADLEVIVETYNKWKEEQKQLGNEP